MSRLSAFGKKCPFLGDETGQNKILKYFPKMQEQEKIKKINKKVFF